MILLAQPPSAAGSEHDDPGATNGTPRAGGQPADRTVSLAVASTTTPAGSISTPLT